MNKTFVLIFSILLILACSVLAYKLEDSPASQIQVSSDELISSEATISGVNIGTTAIAETTLPEMQTSTEIPETTELSDFAVEEGIVSSEEEAEPTKPAAINTPEEQREPYTTISDILIPDMNWNGIDRLCQQDKRWAAELYSRNTIAGGGCGLISLSRALSYTTGKEVMPLDLIDLKDPYGRVYRFASPLGTDSNLFPSWAAYYDTEVRTTRNPNVARYEIEHRGAVAIAKIQGGAISQRGHYVLLVELNDKNGTILDPTLEGIAKFPDGIVSNVAITSYSMSFSLFYPLETVVPDQDRLLELSQKSSFVASHYQDVAKSLEEQEDYLLKTDSSI